MRQTCFFPGVVTFSALLDSLMVSFICWNEDPRQEEEIYMFHPVHTFINKYVRDFEARPVLSRTYLLIKVWTGWNI
jgi:hypothetical protein